MAKGDRKGLPIKKKAVTRITKSGKFSSYTQSYHLNPFKKQSNKNKAGAVPLTKADRIAEKMKSKPAIDKRASMEATLSNVNPTNTIGSLKVDKICSKLKTIQDVQTLTSNLLDNSFKTLNAITTKKDITKINEHSRLLNNIPNTTEAYSTVVGSLMRSKNRMAPEAFSSLIFSFNDHALLEKTFTNRAKSEAYMIDELRHDWEVEYTNPLTHVTNYYSGDLGDNLRGVVNNLQQKDNDLTYLNNNFTLTDREVDLTQRWIDFNNDEASKGISAGYLKNKIFIKLDKNLAAMIHSSSTPVTFNLYNSTIYEFKNGNTPLKEDEWKKIKDIKIINDSNFTLHNSSFYIRLRDNSVYFIADISVKNTGDYNFISVSKKDTSNFIDKYNDVVLKSINTSKLSESEIKDKIWKLDNRYNNIDNHNSYLVI